MKIVNTIKDKAKDMFLEHIISSIVSTFSISLIGIYTIIMLIISKAFNVETLPYIIGFGIGVILCVISCLLIYYFYIKNSKNYSKIKNWFFNLHNKEIYERLYDAGTEVMTKTNSNKLIVLNNFNEDTNEIECGMNNEKKMYNQNVLIPYKYTSSIIFGESNKSKFRW